MYRWCLVIAFALTLVWGLGCGSGRKGLPPSAKVTGTITQDGRPIPSGEIHFGITGAPPGVVTIKDGTFAGDAPVGKNKVEVYVYAETASAKDRNTKEKRNTLPDKYWGPNTTLEATVTEGGPNEFKFVVTSR
jgi:hypothetical protein